MVYLITFLVCGYIVLLTLLFKGWRRVRAEQTAEPAPVLVSVIVPFRNEALCIKDLVEDLKNQEYTNFEVWMVDDHSSDESVAIIKGCITGYDQFNILSSVSNGKKQAISVGVQHAKGSIIITTDADCRLNPQWLSCMVKPFRDATVMMVSGGVTIIEDSTFFSRVQALEFASLIGSGAAMIGLHCPVLCNGANLAFRKEAFEKVKGYEGNVHIASGDDEFLMREIDAAYKNSIRFMNIEEAVVRTKAAPSLSAFFQQRLRWAGKWRHNSSMIAQLLAVYVLLLQLSLIVTMGMLFSDDYKLMTIAAAILFCRAAFEFIFLKQVCAFLKLRWRWNVFFVLQLAYPFYVVITGLFVHVSTTVWKGRKL